MVSLLHISGIEAAKHVFDVVTEKLQHVFFYRIDVMGPLIVNYLKNLFDFELGK